MQDDYIFLKSSGRLHFTWDNHRVRAQPNGGGAVDEQRTGETWRESSVASVFVRIEWF